MPWGEMRNCDTIAKPNAAAETIDSSRDTDPVADLEKKNELIFGALLEPGAAGYRVREVQASLNRKLLEYGIS